MLAGRTRLAFASRTPGRTQQINLFSLRGGALVADLPGYGYAAVGKELKRAWQDFLWHYITTRPTLVALVLIVDSRHGLKDLDIELLEGFVPSGRPVLILATKADKLNTTAQRAAVVNVRKQIAATISAGRRQRDGAAVLGHGAHRHRGSGGGDRGLAGRSGGNRPRLSRARPARTSTSAQGSVGGKEKAPRPRGVARGP